MFFILYHDVFYIYIYIYLYIYILFYVYVHTRARACVCARSSAKFGQNLFLHSTFLLEIN